MHDMGNKMGAIIWWLYGLLCGPIKAPATTVGSGLPITAMDSLHNTGCQIITIEILDDC